MSISPLNCSSCSTDPYQTNPGQPMKELKALQSALKSGNLTDAQAAFATFQSDIQARAEAGAGKSPLSQNSQIAEDIASLKTALESSDITTAQDAFMTLKQDLRTLKHQHAQDLAGEKSLPPVGPVGTSARRSRKQCRYPEPARLSRRRAIFLSSGERARRTASRRIRSAKRGSACRRHLVSGFFGAPSALRRAKRLQLAREADLAVVVRA